MCTMSLVVYAIDRFLWYNFRLATLLRWNMFGSWIVFKVVFVVFNWKQRLTFFVTKFGFDYFSE